LSEAALADPAYDDIGSVLHEELSRLSARFRVPLVLCYLEGLTAEQAALQLGWPSGTVRSRLARGRERLRARLIRRGVAPSAAVLIAALTASEAGAALPVRLAELTTHSAVLLSAGRLAAGVVPASILTLTEGVLKAMVMTKLKMAATVLVVGLATTALALGQAPAGGGPAPASDPDAARLREVERKLDRVLEALGAISSDERPKLARRSRPDRKSAAPDALVIPDHDSGPPRADEPGRPRYFARRDATPTNPTAVEEPARQPIDGRLLGVVADNNSIERRLQRVEETLGDLVERVRRLERDRSRADKPATAGPYVTPFEDAKKAR
jgi:hypothetical protein